MSRWFRPALRLLVLACVLVMSSAFGADAGQGAASRARAIVTVVDQSGAVVPDATVTLVGVEDATKASTISPVKSSDKGIATIENLAPGRYSIQAEFPGFELGLLKDIRLRSGDNKHVVVLPI